MVITETNFAELVDFVNTHPVWRQKLAKALFPDLDVAKAFQELAESQRQMQQTLQKLLGRVDKLEGRFDHLEGRFDKLETKVDKLATEQQQLIRRVGHLETKADQATIERADMKRDIATLKGFNYETRIIQRADAIFGRFMRRGKDVRNEVGLLLEEAEEKGIISEKAHDDVLALDLLWGGKQKGTKADIVLAIEISWRAEANDIERAVARSETLRKAGLTALSVVAGYEWDTPMIAFARDHKTVSIADMKIDEISWQQAISSC